MPRKSLLLAMMAGAVFIVALIVLGVQSSAGIETKQLQLVHVVNGCFVFNLQICFSPPNILDRTTWNSNAGGHVPEGPFHQRNILSDRLGTVDERK